MSHVIYTGSFLNITETEFWSILKKTTQYHPIPFIVSSQSDFNYIYSLLATGCIPLSQVQLFTIDNYTRYVTGLETHDVKGLLETIVHHACESYVSTESTQTPLYQRHGFIKEITALVRHLYLYPIDFKSRALDWGIRYTDFFNFINATLSKVRQLLQQSCPSHSLLMPLPDKGPMTPLFIFGFNSLTLRHKRLLSTLTKHSQTVSWFIPSAGMLETRTSQTIQWAQTLTPSFIHIPYQPQKLSSTHLVNSSPTLYMASSVQHACEWILSQIKLIQDQYINHSLSGFAIVIPNTPNYKQQLIQIASRSELTLKMTQKCGLSETPLFQSITAIIQLLIYPLSPDTLLTLFMAPLINTIAIHSTPKSSCSPSPLNTALLQWLNAEIDPYLPPEKWINEVTDYYHFLTHSNQTNNDTQTIHISALSEFLAQYKQLQTLQQSSSKINSADTLISLFKTIEKTFYLSSSEKNILNSHYYYFWDSLYVFINYHYNLTNSWDLTLFWQRFSQFATYRSVTEQDKDIDGITVYFSGDWVALTHTHTFVISAAASHWNSSLNKLHILPQHLHRFYHIKQHAAHIETTYLTAFLQLRSLNRCSFIHPTSDQFGQQLLSPWFLDWNQVPLPNTTPPLASSPHNERLTASTLQTPSLNAFFQKQFAQVEFSATSLQDYQSCPHHFFIKRVLKLPSYKPQDDSVNATTWGQLIHQFLQLFFTSTHQNPSLFTKDHFMLTAHSVFESFVKPTFFWKIKKTLLFGNEYKNGLIELLWNYIQSHPLPQAPYDFEAPFLLSLTNDHTSLTIKGAIDLLLGTPHESWMTVLDYKTGKVLPNAKDVEQLRHIQLPIYLLAAAKKFTHHHIAGGMLFQIRDQNTIKHTVICCDPSAKKEVFNLGRKRPYTWDDLFFTKIESYLLQLKRLIDRTEFSYTFYPNSHLTSTKRQQHVCRYCDYHRICRFSERFTST